MSFRRPDQAAMDNETGPAANEELFHQLSGAEEQTYQNSLKASKKRPSIQDPEFAGVYPAAEIAADQKTIDGMRQTEATKTRRSLILEQTIYEYAETADWLAGNSGESYTFQTTEYDDKINRTDLVVEWVINGQVYRLAIDVTSSERDEVIMDKEKTIRNEIESGDLTTIKYFKSQARPKEVGKISHVPRAVIALSREGIAQLCGDLVNKKPKELSANPEQLLILEQISLQMTDQIEYSLGLLLENIETIFQTLGAEETRQLKAVLEKAVDLARQPDKLPEVLATLDQKEKLMQKLRSYPMVAKYLDVIDRQREILNIADEIILAKEKSGEVRKPAAEALKDNIVLRRVSSRLTAFEVPTALEELFSSAA